MSENDLEKLESAEEVDVKVEEPEAEPELEIELEEVPEVVCELVKELDDPVLLAEVACLLRFDPVHRCFTSASGGVAPSSSRHEAMPLGMLNIEPISREERWNNVEEMFKDSCRAGEGAQASYEQGVRSQRGASHVTVYVNP